MDFGVAIPPTPRSWQWVQRAEALGFSHAWFYDSQMLYADVFVAMTAAALHTERIRLGTGVLIPSNRIAPVAANALAALNTLAPGRIDFGVGTGFTGRRTMGLGALRLREVQEYVRVMRDLWRGEIVEFETEGQRRKIRFLDPECAGLDLEHPIPVHLSAFGPRGRAFAAESADGWITFASSDARTISEIEAMREACRRRGRDPASLYTCAFALGCVLADGENAAGPRARAQAGPLATVLLHSFVETDREASIAEPPPELAPLIEAYRPIYASYEPEDARYLSLHRGHLLYVRPEEKPFVVGEFLRAATLTGTAEELRDRIGALREAGYDQLAIQIVPGHEDALEDWADLFSKL